MKLLAIDLGMKLGWATGEVIVGQIERVQSDVFEFTNKDVDEAHRFVALHEWLNDVKAEYSFVFYEVIPRYNSARTANSLAGQRAILLRWCSINGLPTHGITPGEVKKFWTGKGNADKKMMIKESVRRGFDVRDDNEADALAILHCGASLIKTVK